MTLPLPQPYRLCLADSVTGQVLYDLPLPAQLPSWSQQMGASGSLSPQITLGTPLDPDIMARIRERWACTILWSYGNKILQAGLLEESQVDDTQEPPSITFTVVTIWDFLTNRRLVRNRGVADIASAAANVLFGPSSPDPNNRALSWGGVARRLVEIGIGRNVDARYELPFILPDPISGGVETEYVATDAHGVGEVLSSIVSGSPAPEIDIAPVWTDSRHQQFAWRMRTSADGGRLGQMGFPHAWQYKQSAVSLTENPNGTDEANDVVVIGQDSRQDDGTGTIAWAEAIDFSSVDAGSPVLEVADRSHVEETNTSVLAGYAKSRVQSGAQWTGTLVIRNDGSPDEDGIPTAPTLDAISIGDTGLVGINRAGAQHPTLPPDNYALRITAMGSGPNDLTSALSVQILGVVQ